jgi:K+-transporting ATPase A subunit
MTANGWIQIAIFVAILIALARPLGGYMTAVFEGRVSPSCVRSSGCFTPCAGSTSARSSTG